MALRSALWTVSLAALLVAAPAAAAPAKGPTPTGGPAVEDGTARSAGAEARAGKPIASAYLLGSVAFDRKDWAAAASALAVAQASDPADEELARRTFVALLAADRVPQALRLAEMLDERGRTSHLTVALRTVDALQDGRLEDAETLLGTMPQDGLGIYVKPIFTGWTLALQGRTEEALERLGELRNAPGFATLHQINAGLVLAAADRMAEAEPHFLQAVELSPRVQRTNLIVAAMLARAGRTEQARTVIDNYLKQVPLDIEAQLAQERLAAGEPLDDPMPGKLSGLAESLGGVGNALLTESATDIAILYAQLGRFADPDRLALDLLVGDILSTDGQIPAAQAVFRDASQNTAANRADRYMAKLKMADMMSRQERDDEAAVALKELIAEWPERVEAKRELGHLYRREENWGEAVKLYSEVLQQLPDSIPSIWPIYYSRAVSADKLGDWTQAEADLNKALQLSPDQPYLLNYLGYSWIDRNQDIEGGKRLIHKALEKRPNDGHIVDSLGWAHFKLGELKDAVTWMERAVELAPQDAVINDHLGDVYWEVGRYTEARFQWRRALGSTTADELDGQTQAKIDRPNPERKPAGAIKETQDRTRQR